MHFKMYILFRINVYISFIVLLVAQLRWSLHYSPPDQNKMSSRFVRLYRRATFYYSPPLRFILRTLVEIDQEYENQVAVTNHWLNIFNNTFSETKCSN